MLYSVSSQLSSFSPINHGGESSSKIEVPIRSGISVYAQFKYVRGVPAISGQESVSLSRAKIIDNMVSFLNDSGVEEYLNKDEEYTVQELESEVHNVINEIKPHFNTLPGKSIETGVIFSTSA